MKNSKIFKFIDSSATDYGIAKQLEKQMILDGRSVGDDNVTICYANDLGDVFGIDRGDEASIKDRKKTLHRALESKADYIFYSQKMCAKSFERKNCFFLPSAVDDKIFYDKNLSRDFDIGFCGKNRFASRNLFLEGLKNRYAEKFVWKEGIFFDDLSTFYNQCKIVVNNSVVNEITMRMFEATACGALLITREVPHIEDFWEIGKEVITYKDEEDLFNLIDYYLNNEAEARKIAKAGQKRTLKEHKYSDRVKVIYDVIDNKRENISLQKVARDNEYRYKGAASLKRGKKIADIIIPHHNRHDHLFNCLSELPNDIFNIIVVSGGSYAENNNKGAKMAETDNIIILNDDVIPKVDLLVESCNMPADIVGFYQFVPDENKTKSGIYYGVNFRGKLSACLADENTTPSMPTGFCMRIKKEAWEKIGGFDEGFINGGEDHDFGLKAIQLGMSIDYIKEPMVHKHSQSVGRFEYSTENKKRLAKKWSDEEIIKLLNLRSGKGKVLLTNNHLRRLGGSETFTYTMAKELHDRGFIVDVFTFKKGIVSDKISEFANIVDEPSGEYDLILINHNSCLEKVKDVKGFKIFTSHGIYPELEQPVEGADAYVAISKEVQGNLKEKGFESTVIFNGIDCERYKPQKEIGDSIKKIFSLCQIAKANDIISQACEILDIDFDCMGTGNLDLEENRKWDIVDRINDADLVFSLGRGAYEAMACGKSVFVFDTRRYAHVQGGDGIITEENVHKSQEHNMSGRAYQIEYNVAKVVKELRKYSKEQGAFNRKYALENLNIKRQIDKYLEIKNGKKEKEELEVPVIVEKRDVNMSIGLIYSGRITGFLGKWMNNLIDDIDILKNRPQLIIVNNSE